MATVNKGTWDTSKGFEEDSKFHDAWIAACRRVLKPEGTIWISGTYHSIYQCGYMLQKNNFHILNDIAWFKPNAAPNLSCRYFTASHETVIWARKDKKAKHTFNYEEMKNGKFPEDKIKKENAQMRSVWSIPTPKNGEKEAGKHPTQKPLDLLLRIIKASTNNGAIVLDPFNGSGTTGVASSLLGGRYYIGSEIDENYCELTVKRLERIKGDKMDAHKEPEIQLHAKGIVEIIDNGVIVNKPDDIIAILEVMFYHKCSAAIIKKENIGDDFFNLSTGIAGEALQKLSNYRKRMAIIGDFETIQSGSLKDFIYESNKTKQILFVSALDEAIQIFNG
jgi:site-specific DNA-methyltransferase (adenine-specific)